MTDIEPPPRFNTWLREQLRERGISQRRLAFRAGVNHSTISRLIRSQRVPSLQTAVRLHRALDAEAKR